MSPIATEVLFTFVASWNASDLLMFLWAPHACLFWRVKKKSFSAAEKRRSIAHLVLGKIEGRQ